MIVVQLTFQLTRYLSGSAWTAHLESACLLNQRVELTTEPTLMLLSFLRAKLIDMEESQFDHVYLSQLEVIPIVQSATAKQRPLSVPYLPDPQRSRLLEAQYAKVLIGLVRDMKRFLIENMEKILQGKAVRNFSGKTVAVVISNFEVSAQERINQALQDSLSRLTNPIAKERITKSVRTQYKRGITLAEQQVKNLGVPPPTAPPPKKEREVARQLEITNVGLVKTVGEEYLADLQVWVAEYISGNLSYTDLVRKVRSLGLNAEWKVRRIARTETTRTLSLAKMRNYLSAGIERWQWITAVDERVCPICRPLHGKTVLIGRNFTIIGSKKIGKPNTPVKHPPAHPNCRCGVAPSSFGRVLSSEERKRMKDLGWIV